MSQPCLPVVVRRATCLALPVAVVLLSGCGRPGQLGEPPATDVLWCTPQTVSRLYFGFNTPDGAVDEGAWQNFVDAEIARRLPDGFTVLEAKGQWRAPDGRIEREDSRVLEIVAPNSVAHRQVLSDIAGRYKQRFRQQSVLITQSGATSCS